MYTNNLSDLTNESDVEQLFLLPLLTGDMPKCLGIPNECIKTKHNIRRYKIDKGSNAKNYYPDYLIIKDSIPLVVIEAKSPDEDVFEGFRQARLYAVELNASYPSHQNPISIVIASNGITTLLGYWDQDIPILELPFEDIIEQYSEKFKQFYDRLNDQKLKTLAKQQHKLLDDKQFYKPIQFVGGYSKQNEIIKKNSFGATISSKINELFVPENMNYRENIARKAYVNSVTRQSYTNPLYSMIRAAAMPSTQEATVINDLKKPEPIIEKLRDRKNLEHKILLLVGGAGCGKTTFIDHFKFISLPDDLKEKTAWVHINMNHSPVGPDEIYGWIKKEIIDGIKQVNSNIDFDTIENIEKLYVNHLKVFKKIHGSLLGEDSPEYKLKLSDEIQKLQNNLDETAQSYCRFCGGDQGRLIIFVLDNCDKRTLEEQLLMFSVAQWLKEKFRAFVILPLREETYDNYRNRPPLDTVLKDLVFRIEPPDFYKVLEKRINLAMSELEDTDHKNHHYELPNTMHVEYSSEKQGAYLIAIMKSIFANDKTIGDLIIGLAGKNIRTAFEIFLEICNSGYITTDQIFKIKNDKETQIIKKHIILRILLRKNRTYYKGEEAYIKNIFNLSMDFEYKNYFYRFLILLWLQQRIKDVGPTKLHGYFPISLMVSDLMPWGLGEDEIVKEIEYLAESSCLVSEDFQTSSFTKETLIKLATPGNVHLNLLKDINYWAAIAEDTLFDDKNIAKIISQKISDPKIHLTRDTTFENTTILLDYIIKHFNAAKEKMKTFISEEDMLKNIPNFEEIKKAFYDEPLGLKLINWDNFTNKYKEGQLLTVFLSRQHRIGFFADIEFGFSGLIDQSELTKIKPKYLKIGDQVNVIINKIDSDKRYIFLTLR